MDKRANPLWVSHSSLGDFLGCPRAYYLKNIYKDPITKRKMAIASSSLSLGSAVHEVLEGLANLPAETRFDLDLEEEFNLVWSRYSGLLGGFYTKEEEEFYKKRGLEMILRVKNNPGPLKNKALKLKSPDSLPPRYFISETENILLCGKIDWLEYFPEDDSVHILDFKTGKGEEKTDSLQLPIYTLLVANCQKRKIKKISYWYIDRDDSPIQMELPDLEISKKRVMEVAIQVKQARLENKFECPKNGCRNCEPFEKILNKQATFIKSEGYQDIYMV